MSTKSKWISRAGMGLMAATLAATALLSLPQVSLAAPATSAETQGRGPGGPGGQNDTYLADALGITVDELQAAQDQAREAAIDQALEQGLITAAQAEVLREGDGFGRGGAMMMYRLGGGDDSDQHALLAEALGVTVDELEAAQQEAQQAASEDFIAQAIEDGRMTQEQADLMQARQKLGTWIREQGFFAKAVEAAVKAGVITQAQADAILSPDAEQGLRGFGMGEFGMGRMGGGAFGMGGFGGRGGGCGGRMGGLGNGSAE
jgi:hypothetical protein